ncbi:hypothetical protein EYF80_050437 [Liparis tanakae]|uniref:Uncharacterized protein n=1 Tax=Liparis tanakae TaxID=230148 RepID=A0A4Z2FDU3_9TELE|nr:hypothetical protein EYF80_050437 [Liparis tanakae]
MRHVEKKIRGRTRPCEQHSDGSIKESEDKLMRDTRDATRHIVRRAQAFGRETATVGGNFAPSLR